MSIDARYALAGIGVAGMMVAGYHSGDLLTHVGKYYLPAVAGIGRAGLMVAGLRAYSPSWRNFQKSSLRIEDTGLSEVPTATFTITCAAADRPLDGQPVIIGIGSYHNPIFGGYLTNPQETHLGGDQYAYKCTAEGWTRDLRKRLISAIYENQWTGDMIEDLISTYVPHFHLLGNVGKGVYLREISFDFLSLLEACNELATRSGYLFWIDPLKEVHFKPQEKQTATWNLDTTEKWSDLNISEDSSQIKTRVIVRYSVLEERTDTFTGDGSTEVFILTELPHEITSLTVEGAAVTYGSRYHENNENNDFSVYYDKGELHAQAYGTPDSGDSIVCAYTAKIPARLIVNHAAAQLDRRVKEGGDGIYDLLITDREGILSTAEARERAEAEFEAAAWPLITATYTCKDAVFDFLTHRLRVGMSQQISARGRNLTLTVERVSIGVATRDGSPRWKLQQDVSLGPVPGDLGDLFQELFDEPSDVANEERTAEIDV